MTSVILAVEGDTDVPFAQKLLQKAGLAIGKTIRSSKSRMDPQLMSWNRAAGSSPWFVMRDLDQDASCAPGLVQSLVPHRQPLFCLRVVVRALEAWALADADAVARYFCVRSGAVSGTPDAIANPKRYLVDLARRSTKKAIVKDMVPGRGASRPVGPGFERRLIEFGTDHWRLEVARRASPSLQRAVYAASRLREQIDIR